MITPVVPVATTIVVVSAMVSIAVAEGSVAVTLVLVTLIMKCNKIKITLLSCYLLIDPFTSQKLP